MSCVRIVDPSGTEPSTTRFIAPERPRTLAGGRLAVLDNGKPNAGYVVATLAGHLQRRFAAGEVSHTGKAVAARPCPDEVLAGYRGFDAAIVGVGD